MAICVSDLNKKLSEKAPFLLSLSFLWRIAQYVLIFIIHAHDRVFVVLRE